MFISCNIYYIVDPSNVSRDSVTTSSKCGNHSFTAGGSEYKQSYSSSV